LERDRAGRGAFDAFACGLLRPQLDRLGWDARAGEPESDALLRGALISALGDYGDPGVIAEARERYAKFLTAPESLAADLRPPVLRIVGRCADQKTYDAIHKLALAAGGTEDRQMYYRAMTGALDTNLARATLALSLTNETSPQEATALVREVAHNGGHPALAWEFFRQHSRELLGRVDSFERNNYVPSILDAFSDAARADELEAYVKKNLPRAALAKSREAAEAIRFKADLKTRELPAIDKWVAAPRGQ
jgi:aminopeptidase N